MIVWISRFYIFRATLRWRRHFSNVVGSFATRTCGILQAGRAGRRKEEAKPGRHRRVIDACSTVCLPTYAGRVADTSVYVCINSHLSLDNKVSTERSGHTLAGSAGAIRPIDHRAARSKKSGPVRIIAGSAAELERARDSLPSLRNLHSCRINWKLRFTVVNERREGIATCSLITVLSLNWLMFFIVFYRYKWKLRVSVFIKWRIRKSSRSA